MAPSKTGSRDQHWDCRNNIRFTGNPKALQNKHLDTIGLKEGLYRRGWPRINPAHLDLRPVPGYINKSSWRDADRKPKLLSLASIRYRYWDAIAEAWMQAVSTNDFNEASLSSTKKSIGGFPSVCGATLDSLHERSVDQAC